MVDGIFWFACGALLGWPFAGALIVPFLLEQLLLTCYTRNFYTGTKNLLNGALRCLTLLASPRIFMLSPRLTS
jgi:alpha-1,2-mannosyltransferase